MSRKGRLRAVLVAVASGVFLGAVYSLDAGGPMWKMFGWGGTWLLAIGSGAVLLWTIVTVLRNGPWP